MKAQQLEIQRAVAEIENIYPPDDYISSYKSFLMVRNTLHFCQFNPVVFSKLVELTVEIWDSQKRISRQSLISVARRYLGKEKSRIQDLNQQTQRNIFKLFEKVVILEDLNLCHNSKTNLQNTINSLLIGVRLEEFEIQILLGSYSKSNHILNRILRHPYKSSTISTWARNNFEKNELRHRRAELTSWIIDIDPDFVIDKETLFYDFQYLNALDKKAIQKYIDEKEAQNAINKQLNDVLDQAFDRSFWGEDENAETFVSDVSKLCLNRRFYPIPLYNDSRHNIRIPDFEKLEEDYFENESTHHTISMVWSIAYSRVDIEIKERLLTKYYITDIYWSFLRIAKLLKSTKLLKWLGEVENQEP